MASVFPSGSYVCWGPASPDTCLGVTLTKIFILLSSATHKAGYTSGQIRSAVPAIPPHSSSSPTLSLLPGNVEEWEIEKALTLFKQCSTMNKTLTCYQCYFGPKSKVQHHVDCNEKRLTPFQTDPEQDFAFFYADQRFSRCNGFPYITSRIQCCVCFWDWVHEAYSFFNKEYCLFKTESFMYWSLRFLFILTGKKTQAEQNLH